MNSDPPYDTPPDPETDDDPGRQVSTYHPRGSYITKLMMSLQQYNHLREFRNTVENKLTFGHHTELKRAQLSHRLARANAMLKNAEETIVVVFLAGDQYHDEFLRAFENRYPSTARRVEEAELIVVRALNKMPNPNAFLNVYGNNRANWDVYNRGEPTLERTDHGF